MHNIQFDNSDEVVLRLDKTTEDYLLYQYKKEVEKMHIVEIGSGRDTLVLVSFGDTCNIWDCEIYKHEYEIFDAYRNRGDYLDTIHECVLYARKKNGRPILTDDFGHLC